MTTSSAFAEQGAPGEAFVPVEGSISRTGARPPKLEPNDAFLLVYDANRYTVMDGVVVPALKRVVLTPGINGCSATYDRDGRVVAVQAGMARAMAEERGNTIIPLTAVPPSQHHLHNNGGRAHLWKPAGTGTHLTIWETAYAGAKRTSTDTAAYVAWFAWLVEQRIIPPPQAHVLRELLAQRVEERDKMSDRAATVPSVRPLANQLAKDCEVIEAAIKASGAKVDEEDEEVPSGPPAEGATVVVDDGAFATPATPAPKKGR